MTASAGISYLWQDTRFSVDIIAGTGLRTHECQRHHSTAATVPSYEQVNLGISHRFEHAPGGPIEIRADLINVLDEIYLHSRASRDRRVRAAIRSAAHLLRWVFAEGVLTCPDATRRFRPAIRAAWSGWALSSLCTSARLCAGDRPGARAVRVGAGGDRDQDHRARRRRSRSSRRRRRRNSIRRRRRSFRRRRCISRRRRRREEHGDHDRDDGEADGAPPRCRASPSSVMPRIDLANSHEPEYPPISRRLGEQGSVIAAKCWSSVGGRVLDEKVVQSSGSERLDQAALAGVKANYRFVPGTLDGEPQRHVVHGSNSPGNCDDRSTRIASRRPCARCHRFTKLGPIMFWLAILAALLVTSAAGAQTSAPLQHADDASGAHHSRKRRNPPPRAAPPAETAAAAPAGADRDPAACRHVPDGRKPLRLRRRCGRAETSSRAAP